jgi:very-short-patch-repair endonuclease
MRPELHRRRSNDGEWAVRYRESPDGTIARLASRHFGVVSRKQLLGAGVDPDAIKRRLRSGLLTAVHRGVYVAGHTALAERALEMAAILACGTGAVVSRHTAAYRWQLLPHPAEQRPVDITIAGRHPGRRAGIRVHRVASLDRRDFWIRDSIPITTPARTLLDLAAVGQPAELDRAFAEAQVLRLVDVRGMEDQIARNPGRTGVRALRALVDAGPAPTRNDAEQRLLRLIRDAGLPRPQVNAYVGRYEVDCLWSRHRLVVELDGWATHGHRRAFERDRDRDAALAAAGYTVLRITWRQLTRQPERVVARIAAALAARPA